MDPLPDRRRSPRESATLAAALFGHAHVVRWCEELLIGDATDTDPRYPDITWLRGTAGWPEYWSRVWGARGLLHVGPPARPEIVLLATGDRAWRVREMSLKVIAAHALPDPTGVVDRLVDDPVERVRRQAWRTLGMPRRVDPAGFSFAALRPWGSDAPEW